MTYCIVVNESMLDAAAWIEAHDGEGVPDVGPWERVYSCHETREEALAALPDAREYAAGRLLP